jgi:hypothetical protein
LSDDEYALGLSHDARYALMAALVSTTTCSNTCYELYRWDRLTGRSVLVSRSDDGAPANANTQYGSMSATGRYFVFSTSASNLVSDDTNKAEDTFWHDVETGRTVRVSVTSSGEQAQYTQSETAYQDAGKIPLALSAISADGLTVDFDSVALNLAPEASTTSAGSNFVYRHDLRTGSTTLESPWAANAPALTADGSVGAFYGYADAAAYNNGDEQAIVHLRPDP